MQFLAKRIDNFLEYRTSLLDNALCESGAGEDQQGYEVVEGCAFLIETGGEPSPR